MILGACGDAMCIDIPDKLRDVGFAFGLVEAYFAEDAAGRSEEPLARAAAAALPGGQMPKAAQHLLEPPAVPSPR